MSSPTSPRLNETRALGGWGHTSLSLRPETAPGAGQGSTAQTHQEGLTEAATFHKGLEGQVRGDDCWVRRVRKAAARESLSSRSALLPERHRRQEGQNVRQKHGAPAEGRQGRPGNTRPRPESAVSCRAGEGTATDRPTVEGSGGTRPGRRRGEAQRCLFTARGCHAEHRTHLLCAAVKDRTQSNGRQATGGWLHPADLTRPPPPSRHHRPPRASSAPASPAGPHTVKSACSPLSSAILEDKGGPSSGNSNGSHPSSPSRT